MAKNYELGRDYYLPVTVHKDGSEDDVKFPIGIKYNDGNKEMTDYIMDKPDLLLTAKEVAKNELGEPGKDYILLDKNNFMMMPTKTTVVSEEETRIKTLTDKIAILTDERDVARKQADIFQEEIKKLTAERDKFAKCAKDKADLANKACDERNDVQGDLVTAREAIDYLQEENNKLKQEVENRMTDYKLMRDNNAVYLSRIATQNEVINALVEKIRRLEGDKK